MSEMGGVSADSGGSSGVSADSGGSADAPTSIDQPSVADDQIASAPDGSSPEVASAGAENGPPPVAGTSKLSEPGKATSSAGADARQAAAVPKPAEPGKATAPARLGGDWHWGGFPRKKGR